MDYCQEDILGHVSYKNYIKYSMREARYCKAGVCSPPEVLENYKNALNAYRDFLDKLGCTYPEPLYPYLHKEKHTWLWSDLNVPNVKCLYKIKK